MVIILLKGFGVAVSVLVLFFACLLLLLDWILPDVPANFPDAASDSERSGL